MRTILAGLGMWVALASVAPLCAQGPSSNANVYEKDGVLSSGRRPAGSEQIIFERASHEAQERIGRMESRHRLGISMQRPSVYSGSLVGTTTHLAGPWTYYYSGYWICP